VGSLADRHRSEGWRRAHDDICDLAGDPLCPHANPFAQGVISGPSAQPNELDAEVVDMLGEVVCFKNVNWETDSDGLFTEEASLSPARIATTVQDPQAEAASSRIRPVSPWVKAQEQQGHEIHYLMLDIDAPAALIPSSTGGHHHLYIGIPMTWEKQLLPLLKALRDAKIIEDGFYYASEKRRATFLRLPWIKKGEERQPDLSTPEGVQAFLEGRRPRDLPINPDPWAGVTRDDLNVLPDVHPNPDHPSRVKDVL
jgi:hypothetical protein